MDLEAIVAPTSVAEDAREDTIEVAVLHAQIAALQDAMSNEANVVEAFTAFAKAQGEIGNVLKNAENSFFKNAKGKASKFADLAAVNEAVIPALSANNLFITQTIPREGEIHQKNLIVRLFHGNGTLVSETFYPILSKDYSNPQAFGAAVTYARRYATMALLNVAAEDDDGNTAAQPAPSQPTPTQTLGKLLKESGVTAANLKTVLADRFPDKQFENLKDVPAKDVINWVNELENPSTNF